MPTTKARINITLPEEIRGSLRKLAKRDHVPEATKAARLIELALESEEDLIWDKLAAKRDTPNSKFVPHSRAWQ